MSEIGSLLIHLCERREEKRSTLVRDVITPMFTAARGIVTSYRSLLETARAAAEAGQLPVMQNAAAECMRIRNSYLAERQQVTALSEVLSEKFKDDLVGTFAWNCTYLFFERNFADTSAHATNSRGFIILRAIKEAAAGKGKPGRVIDAARDAVADLDYEWERLCELHAMILTQTY